MKLFVGSHLSSSVFPIDTLYFAVSTFPPLHRSSLCVPLAYKYTSARDIDNISPFTSSPTRPSITRQHAHITPEQHAGITRIYRVVVKLVFRPCLEVHVLTAAHIFQYVQKCVCTAFYLSTALNFQLLHFSLEVHGGPVTATISTLSFYSSSSCCSQ